MDTSAGRPLEVLVVDDEPALCELVAANLAAGGHRTRIARDGIAALSAIEAERPDVVVLDVLMPRLDGWGVLEALAEQPETADLPVVMLTALSSEQDVIRAHLTGAVQYLTKPFEVARLLEAVARAAQEPTDDQRAERRQRLRTFLARLAELDAGRVSDGPRVRFSGLEAVPGPVAPPPPPDAGVLTPRQRLVAGLLADGVPPRVIAERLGTSRSNVYATRNRIARHLRTEPELVADVARRAGLTAETVADDGREDDGREDEPATSG